MYDDHEELSSAFQSTLEHLTDSDYDFDEERILTLTLILRRMTKYFRCHCRMVFKKSDNPYSSKI